MLKYCKANTAIYEDEVEYSEYMNEFCIKKYIPKQADL